VRIPIDIKTYARPEFDILAARGDYDVGMGRIPLLQHGDFTLGQSKAIERYVAGQLGLAGSSAQEAAAIDMIGGHVADIKDKFVDAKRGKTGEELAAARAKFLAEDLCTWLGKLEKTLGAGGFAVGSKLSLADVIIHQLVTAFFDEKAEAAAAAAKHHKVAASVAAVDAAGAAYFAARPASAF